MLLRRGYQFKVRRYLVDVESFVAFVTENMADEFRKESLLSALSIDGTTGTTTSAQSFLVLFYSPFTRSFNVDMAKISMAFLDEHDRNDVGSCVLITPLKTTAQAISRLAGKVGQVQQLNFQECLSNYINHKQMPQYRILRGAAKTQRAKTCSVEQGKKMSINRKIGRFFNLKRRDLVVSWIATHVGPLQEYRWGAITDK
jgi:hypothetical protein